MYFHVYTILQCIIQVFRSCTYFWAIYVYAFSITCCTDGEPTFSAFCQAALHGRICIFRLAKNFPSEKRPLFIGAPVRLGKCPVVSLEFSQNRRIILPAMGVSSVKHSRTREKHPNCVTSHLFVNCSTMLLYYSNPASCSLRHEGEICPSQGRELSGYSACGICIFRAQIFVSPGTIDVLRRRPQFAERLRRGVVT
jgi:hypothetical protein